MVEREREREEKRREEKRRENDREMVLSPELQRSPNHHVEHMFLHFSSRHLELIPMNSHRVVQPTHNQSIPSKQLAAFTHPSRANTARLN